MEQFLNTVHSAKACFEKHNLNAVMNMNTEEAKHLCFQERKNLAAVLMSDKLLTTNLIKERLNVIHENRNVQAEARKQFLDAKL